MRAAHEWWRCVRVDSFLHVDFLWHPGTTRWLMDVVVQTSRILSLWNNLTCLVAGERSRVCHALVDEQAGDRRM